MRTSINKKSDFDFIVLDNEGNAVDMPSNDFTLDLWTWGSKCRFRASSIGGVLKGCKNDNGKLRVYVDNPGFVPGKLVGEWITYAASEEYADGSQRTCRYISDFGIDMVDGDSTTNEQQVLAMMQYIQGASAYEIACEHGYQGTEEEWLNSLSLESVNAANECRELMAQLSAAEDVRNDNEQTRIANEQARVESENSRSFEESNRVDAESTRIHNESVRHNREKIRQDAENYRITHENSRESNETMRQNSETARVTAEESRVTAEESRQANEQTRETAEASRITAESSRDRTHDRLKAAMREYADAESLREESEAERREAEQYRIQYEQSRQSAEADRATNERNRATAEQQRVAAETARSNAESNRAASETARQTAETSRQEAEQGRVTAEQQRADAEAARAEEFTTFEGKIAAKEDAANKVTSIGADADDQHYPSAKAVLDVTQEIAKAIEDKYWYGVEWDLTISEPTCTRIGNMELHRTLPVQSQMRGCLLADDGTVNKYLNPDDWTSEVRDGSQGMVMVELPRYFRKFETEGNKLRVKFSLLPLEGFHEVKKKYVSAYEAAIERSTGKLCSVVNEGANYRGGDNRSGWDGTYKSQLGMPVSAISRIDLRTAAHKRGSVNWNLYTYDIHKDLYWLYVCEYATLNSQAGYTEELTAEGYHQGGLGVGVTNMSYWNEYNSYRPVAKCGLTDYAGNKTTQLPLHLENDDATSVSNVNVPRYRGVEHPFGHIWKIIDAVNVIISPTEANGGDDTSKVYVCNNPNYFNDSNVDGYTYIGNESRIEGYVKQLLLGEFGEIVPTICGGAGASTYYCDYHYTNIPKSASDLRVWMVGGIADLGSLAGIVYVSSRFVPLSADVTVGSRLCYIPTENFE